MSEIAVLGEYNGHRIRVHAADDAYVNATDMAKSCGKLWAHYRALDSTGGFLEALSLSIGIPIDRLIQSRPGRPDRGGGTWIHRKIAIDFAGWLSPEFKVLCINWLDEFMRTGRVVLHREHQEHQVATASNPDLARIVCGFERALNAVEKSNEMTAKMMEWTFAIYESLQRKKPEALEDAVEKQLLSREGGMSQVRLCPGLIADVITADEVVEIKHHRQWKAGLGQATLYGDMLPEKRKRLHLFAKPLDRLPPSGRRRQIEHKCHRVGVRVTWHEWQRPQVPKKRQQTIPYQW